MVRHSLKQLAANKSRLILTAFAIVISVAFVVASFVMSDGISTSLSSQVDKQTEGIDLAVSPQTPFESQIFDGSPQLIDDQTLTIVASMSGVSSVVPNFTLPDELSFRPPGSDGKPIDSSTFIEVSGWVDGGSLKLSKGQAPSGPDEFVVDPAAAKKFSYTVGSTYSVATPSGARQMRLSGLTEKSVAGDTIVAIEMNALQELLGNPGYSSLSVTAAESADVTTLKNDIENVLPQGLGVKTKAEIKKSFETELSKVTGIFQNIMLGFAFISVFVSAFIIYNTFSVLVTQRTKEIGLLRAIGASPKQVRRSIQAEALALGILASSVGIGVGIGLNYGLQALLNAFGAQLPKADFVLAPRTVFLGMAVGVIITLISAMTPARRACRVPAIVALTSGTVTSAQSSRKRLVIGATLATAGIAALAMGLSGVGTTPVTILGLCLGAAMTFTAVAMLNPVWVVQITNVLGWPFRMLAGIPGKVASENTARNPVRSASTAASLMIGLALVSMVLVVGQSVKSTQSGGLTKTIKAEYVVSDTDGTTYPIDIAEKLKALDVVEKTTTLQSDTAQVGDTVQQITVTQMQAADGLLDFGLTAGVAASPSVDNPVIVSKKHADKNGIKVDDTTEVTFSNGEQRTLTVVGIFQHYSAEVSDHIVDQETWFEATGQNSASTIVIEPKDGVSKSDFSASVQQFNQDFPQVEVRTLGAYVKQTEKEISKLLTIVNLMILMAVLISFMGIASTLALSTFERSKEIGLLRAVGMHRGQLRRTIRYEAILVSLFGAVMGTALGSGFGVVAVGALPTWFAESVAVPSAQLTFLILFAALAAVLAAALPAWRASRSNPLELISG